VSADNYAICPRCFQEACEKAAAERQRVTGLYGTLPVEEFDAQRAALKTVEAEDYRTFREDYEFYGADDGEIRADYSGHCSVCSLQTELTARRRFWPEAAA
jgi:hypothetical protein